MARHRPAALTLAFLSFERQYPGEQMKSENGGRGEEKENGGADAGGRSRQVIYSCFNCGAENYVDPNWTWFTCWKCDMKKPLPLPGH